MSIVLSARPSLLDNSGKWLGYIDDGNSIADIIDLFHVSEETRNSLVVHIGDRFVDRSAWAMITPKPDMRVTVSYAYRGSDGKQILSVVAMIGLAVFAPYIAAGINTGMGLGLGATGMSVLTTGVMLIGSLAISALFPPPEQDTSDVSESYSFSGLSNTARPGEGIMRVFGRIRVFPDIAAMPYSTVYDGDEYLTAAFSYGYAEISLSDTTVGAVSWDDMKDASLTTHSSYTDGGMYHYPDDVFQDDISITLTNEEGRPNSDWWGPPSLDENWYVVRSQVGTDNASFTFSMPQGLTSGTDTTVLNIFMYYRVKGDTTWINVHDLPNTLASTDDRIYWIYNYDVWHMHQEEEIHRPYLTSITMEMPSRDQYEFRVGRSYWGKDDSEKHRKCDIRYLRSIKEEMPIVSPVPITISELKVRATDQLSGVIDDISSLCEANIPVIESDVWVAAKFTNNPVWIYLSILKSKSNTNAIDDYEIDLESFIDWAAYCDQTFDSKTFITCNLAHTGKETVDQMLQKVAACGNASRTTRDGKQSIIWDAVQAYPTQVFTQRNSWGFQLQKKFVERPHGLIINYLDEEDDYKVAEVIVYSPGYDETNATKFENMDAFGCTREAQADRFGLRYLAMGRYRSEFFSFYADVENLASERGDRIRVSYDAVKEGGKAGRVMELLETAGSVTGLRLDQKHYATFSYSEHHGVLIRTVLNDEPYIFVQEVDEVIDEYSLQFVSPVSEHIEVGNIAVFGELEEISEDYLITKINPGADLTAQIECTPYASEMQEIRNGGTETDTCGMSVVALPERADILESVNLSLRHDIGTVASVSWSIPGSDTPTSNLEYLTVTYATNGVYVVTCSVTYDGGENCNDSTTITIG